MSEDKKNPFVYKDETDNWVITEEGHAFLTPKVTSTTDRVYAFTPEANPIEVAAAMARLSRRDGTLLSCILDEFAMREEGADDLLDRVITQFGDDSVANLFSFYIVTESISNLATKQVEWSRIASYLEQSTRYIYYFNRQADGTYKYFRPTHLPADLLELYIDKMDKIFDLYAETVQAMSEYIRTKNPRPDKETDPTGHMAWVGATRAQACDAVRTMLPAATLSTVGIHCSALSVDNMVKHLWAEPLPEMNELGTKILAAAKQVAPIFLKRTDQPDRGLVDVAYRRENRERMESYARTLYEVYGVEFQNPDSVDVKVSDFWPLNEEDFLAQLCFARSSLSTEQLQASIGLLKADMTDEEFAEYVKQMIADYCGDRLNRRHKPGRALEQARVKIKIVGDYGTFRDLQRHRQVDGMEWQRIGCDLGYDVPALVKEAGLETKFEEAFELSGWLWDQLRMNGFEEEAQYAVCMGYRMRYSFFANVRELFHLLELRTSPQGHPGYRAICNEIYRQLQVIWPNIAAAMKFVNQSDNLDELTRMASERNTAAKLRELGIVPSDDD